MTSQRRKRPDGRAAPAIEAAPPQSFIGRLNDFLSRVHTTPLWIAATAVAAASFTFAVSFVDNYAEREAHFEQDTLKHNNIHAIFKTKMPA